MPLITTTPVLEISSTRTALATTPIPLVPSPVDGFRVVPVVWDAINILALGVCCLILAVVVLCIAYNICQPGLDQTHHPRPGGDDRSETTRSVSAGFQRNRADRPLSRQSVSTNSRRSRDRSSETLRSVSEESQPRRHGILHNGSQGSQPRRSETMLSDHTQSDGHSSESQYCNSVHFENEMDQTIHHVTMSDGPVSVPNKSVRVP